MPMKMIRVHDSNLSSREERPRLPGTPRPRKGPTATGRSPGSRVDAFATAFPDMIRWRDRANTLRSQLRGQPRCMARRHFRVPF